MQIFITGGTGLIGRHLIKACETHHRITVLTRSKDKAIQKLPTSVALVTSLDDIEDFSHFDAVINLAGEPIADKRWTEQQKKKICSSRWQLTHQLADKVKLASTPPRVFISGSAVGYYGRQGQQTVTESQYQIHDEFTHQVCAKWEHIAQEARSDATRVCLIRTGIVLDKDAGALKKMALPFKLGVGGKISHGKQVMSWIHVEDEVAAILFLLNNSECEGAYNLTAPQPVTNAEFSAQLASALRRPNIFKVPEVVVKLMLGETADLLLTGQRVLPERLLAVGFKFKYATLSSALNAEFG